MRSAILSGRSAARSLMRRTLLATGIAGGAIVLAAVAVFADAPSPTTIKATVDGMTVTLEGDWEWPEKTDPCGPGTSANRAAGWAADWGDGFAGNILPRKGLSSAYNLHMGAADDNLVRTSDANDGLGDCGTANLGGKGVVGTFGPISHTYAIGGTYEVCVVTYDVKYATSRAGIIVKDRYQLVAGGSGRNKDNSAEDEYPSGKYGLQTVCEQVDIFLPAPELTLTKTADVADYDSTADTIDYTFTVENTGNVPLAGPVVITDDLTSDESCPAVSTVGNTDGNLDPGESIDCTATYDITQDDLDAGSLTNTASASADGTVSNEDSVTLDAIQNPSISLLKEADPTSVDAVSDVIDYTFTVENTGNVSLLGPVTIVDDLTTDEDCPDVSTVGDFDDYLDPEESIECTASYTVTQADLDAGSIDNTATASVDGTDSSPDSATVDVIEDRDISLVKTADVDTYDAVDDVITYTFTVENIGNVRLKGPITIDDDLTTDESCPDVDTVGNFDVYLDPGETIECDATYTVDQADLNAGVVENTATATSDDDGDPVDSNQDGVTVDAVQNPELDLVKEAVEASYRDAGNTVHYTFTVTNTGNISLDGPVTITDNKTTNEDCPNVNTVGNNNSKLDPGEVIVCTASRTVTSTDVTNGSIVNQAKAAADGVDSNTDSVTIDRVLGPALKLTKTAVQSEFGRNDPYKTIDYRFTVKNIGDRPVDGPVTIDDDQTTDESCPDVSTVGDFDGALDPDETIVCTATYTVTDGDIIAGKVKNTATASAGEITSPPSSVTVPEAPVYLVILDASGSGTGAEATTIRTYNTNLRKWKAETQIAPYTLLLFNTKTFNYRYRDQAIDTIPNLTDATFNPRYGTPLWDDVTRAIQELEDRNPIGPVTVKIQSDGQDTASTTYTRTSVNRLLARKQRDGWKITLIGFSLPSVSSASISAR